VAGDTISEPNEAIKGAGIIKGVTEVGGIEEDKVIFREGRIRCHTHPHRA
jgi:hypothetical protein